MKQRPSLYEKSFWSWQYKQIKEEGFPAVWRKAKKMPKVVLNFPFVFLSFPVVLVIRVLKPIVWIRFGHFLATRIGHFVFDVEYYLCERKTEKQPTKTIDIFFYRWGRPANPFFAKMCERQIRVRNWAKYIYFANHGLPGGHDHEVSPAYLTNNSQDVKGLFQQIETQLYFTEEENLQGQIFLEEVGFSKDAKFVCLIVRDAAYLSQHPEHSKVDFSYHNYRDTDIEAYADAAMALALKGYCVFRMGKVVQKPLKISHPRILDYANSDYRSDFLDIWLAANCFFCISTGTGLDEIPRAFRRPAVYVNYIPFQLMVTYDHCISVPKHLVWQDKKRRLTLTEHLMHPYYSAEEYVKEKIMIQDLSSEEILRSVMEMESRLTGEWKDTKEDIQMQHRFWKLFKENVALHNGLGRIHPQSRVSSSFLMANKQWLN